MAVHENSHDVAVLTSTHSILFLWRNSVLVAKKIALLTWDHHVLGSKQARVEAQLMSVWFLNGLSYSLSPLCCLNMT